MTTRTDVASGPTFSWRAGWRYGLMGLPLAFVALPLYVLLPNHYAREFGLSLGGLGALLLAVRLFDAVIDPWLGRWADRLFAHSPSAVLGWGALAAALLCAGFALMFSPPLAVSGTSGQPLMLWLGLSLLLTTVAYSALSILHQAWGARLGGNEAKRSRVVAWREGFGLAGVVLASILPLVLGLPATEAILLIAAVAAWLAWRAGPTPFHRPSRPTPGDPTRSRLANSVWLPWKRPGFCALMAVFMVNGIASAVPATLILFFVQDRLQAPAAMAPVFLGTYFVCAALALPLWLHVVARLGLVRTWGLGMVLALAVFGFAAQLGAGDSLAFLAVCALSGVAMGTDLALPAALLNGQIEAHGDRGQAEGAYFGWWAFASKLNLALAAGLALPLLDALGYTPGTRDPQALNTLTWAYCLLPCALKSIALALLYTFILRKTP
ncbi:MAG: MFS transporter [Rhodoferax sp.]|uniref:MFS transporter n=1 Tax=Rhodoferax sp. TaxID=50421 RepID=UPI00261BCB6F|nr:MFS transporter [Rhodoferax sp.]MDD2881297.1 MFS transporter [Rhodoferax sp.]